MLHRRPLRIALALALAVVLPAAAQSGRKLRIIGFGAHPDDNEIKMAGTAALWAQQGHAVKFVSVTNGDIGHHQMAGGPLAQRRAAEVQRAAKILGIETEVLDIHDGELLPTLENRAKITRLIRQWKADLVFGPRTNDYHPDHRYTGVLVQDAAYMVTIPFYCSDTPALETNPVFFYYEDGFQKPAPFRPDIVVSIDKVLDIKLRALEQIESQFLDWWQRDRPIDLTNPQVRRATIEKLFLSRFAAPVQRYPELLRAIYGEHAARVRHAEAFELCEYGSRPAAAELRKLFPIDASR
jgi:LmbE family N-acetylglucosaminyl deacetylase